MFPALSKEAVSLLALEPGRADGMEIWILSAPRDFPGDFLPSLWFSREMVLCEVGSVPDLVVCCVWSQLVLGLRRAGEGAAPAGTTGDAGFL